MGNIILRRDNVVKSVDSEDRAKALEAKGFVREGVQKTAPANLAAENATLKEKLAQQSELMEKISERKCELEKELAVAHEKIEALTLELEGTREQLEAATKKNRAAEKKKEGQT